MITLAQNVHRDWTRLTELFGKLNPTRWFRLCSKNWMWRETTFCFLSKSAEHSNYGITPSKTKSGRFFRILLNHRWILENFNTQRNWIHLTAIFLGPFITTVITVFDAIAHLLQIDTNLVVVRVFWYARISRATERCEMVWDICEKKMRKRAKLGLICILDHNRLFISMYKKYCEK